MGNIDCFEFCDDGLKYYQPSSQRISQLKCHYAPLMVIAYGHKFSVSFLLMHRSFTAQTLLPYFITSIAPSHTI